MKNIISTSRLYLREFALNDALSFYNLNNDPEVLKYTGDAPFKSIYEAKIFIQNYAAYKDFGYGRWAVYLKDTTTFIGFCGLKYHPDKKITEVGFRFFKNQWNKGYATESALACINYGFSELKLTKIFAHAHVDNFASQCVLEKCGLHFVKEFMYDTNPTNLYCISNHLEL